MKPDGDATVVDQTSRKLQNELVFRDANERIKRAQAGMDLDGGRLPFICECSDETCREIVQLTAVEYEQIRAGELRFVIAPDHPNDDGCVTHRGERFWILEKA